MEESTINRSFSGLLPPTDIAGAQQLLDDIAASVKEYDKSPQPRTAAMHEVRKALKARNP